MSFLVSHANSSCTCEVGGFCLIRKLCFTYMHWTWTTICKHMNQPHWSIIDQAGLHWLAVVIQGLGQKSFLSSAPSLIPLSGDVKNGTWELLHTKHVICQWTVFLHWTGCFVASPPFLRGHSGVFHSLLEIGINQTHSLVYLHTPSTVIGYIGTSQ